AQDRLADASAYAAEAVGAVRTMQAFGMGAATADRFAQASENAYSAAGESIRARALLTGVAIFLISASVVGVMWYGAQGVLAHTMSAGQLSQFVLYAVFGASALGQLSEVYGELAQAAGAAERLGEILAAVPAIKPPADPV
ncbi:ABC transporter, partial [Methylobacterium sp. WL122]